MRRRLAAARPDVLVTFVNDHVQPVPEWLTGCGAVWLAA